MNTVVVWLASLIMSTTGHWQADPAQTYVPSQIGIAKNVFVGKLTCGGRLIDLVHFQMWCYNLGGKVVHNEITEIIDGGCVCATYYDRKPNEQDAEITWMVAAVEGHPQTLAYQISYWSGTQANQKMLQGPF